MKTHLIPFLSLGLAFSLSGCAVLHHVQVGEIDNRNNKAQIPFEVLMSEMGVNTQEIEAMARATHSNGGDNVGDAAAILSLFQMGPRTGNLVYNPRYAEKLVYELHQKCPSGQITGLVSVREMRKYPAISGEIVKVTGYCLKDRKPVEIGNKKNNEGVF